MRAEVAVEVLLEAGVFGRAKAGWSAVEEPRGSTSDLLRGIIAGYSTGFFDCAPPMLPPPLRSAVTMQMGKGSPFGRGWWDEKNNNLEPQGPRGPNGDSGI